MAALKRAGEGLSRITMKMRKASTPLELAEMRLDEICEILKWARPNSKKWLPGMERTPAQHFLAIGDVWCDACNKSVNANPLTNAKQHGREGTQHDKLWKVSSAQRSPQPRPRLASTTIVT